MNPMDPQPGAAAALRPGPLDVHAHVMPEALLTRLASAQRPGFGVEVEGGRVTSFTLGGAPPGALPAGLYSLELRLRAMDEQGVAVQLLSPTTSIVGYSLSEEDAIWWNQMVNESIAAMVRAMPDRFVGLGSVPLQAPRKAADMLRQLMEEQGLLGVLIAATAGPDRDLDEEALEPFWAAAERLGAFVLIHPHQGVRTPRFGKYYLENLIQNPLDTTIAAARLIFGGILERHPALTICLAHGGGFLPYNLGRLIRGHRARADVRAQMRGAVEESFRRLYFDSVTHSPPALRFLVEQATGEHVLLGSDFPYDMGDPAPPETVRKASLSAEDADLVLRGNADRLLGLAPSDP